MKIFYGLTAGKPDVSSNAPVEAPLDITLTIFRGLDPKSGFLGINLDPPHILQFLPQRRGGIRIELLDTSHPSLDFCVLTAAFAESLIHAAANGEDVFLLARSTTVVWTHLDLRTARNDSSED